MNNLRVVSWNMRRAKASSPAWQLLLSLDVDIALLQEVGGLPDDLVGQYDVLIDRPISRNGRQQQFSTAILSRVGTIDKGKLTSDYQWVNEELEIFSGYLVPGSIKLNGGILNLVSVHSPAWAVNPERLMGIDVSGVKLKLNPDLYCTELLWSALSSVEGLNHQEWIVGGDFNSSVTFDTMWSGGPRGNQEIIDRMNALGLTDALSSFGDGLVPTFRNPKGGKVIHQLDYMYMTKPVLQKANRSVVMDDLRIFEDSHSDHLPVVTDLIL